MFYLDLHPGAHEKCNMQRHKSKLRKLIDPQFGLLDELVARCVMTLEEATKINTQKHDAFGQSTTLIQLMNHKSNEEHCMFIEALKTSDQSHIVNYLQNPGLYKS